MYPPGREKTSFFMNKGLYYYNVMPFGLKNVRATYQRLVNKMFHGLVGRNIEVYIDNMLVKSKKMKDHIIELDEVFRILKQYNMKINPSKCAFRVFSGNFLGFMVSQ